MLKGIKFGFGLLLGAACAAGLVWIVWRHPLAFLGGSGAALAVLLLVIGVFATRRLVMDLPLEVHMVVAPILLAATGWCLATDVFRFGIFLPGWFGAVVRVVGWALTGAGCLLLLMQLIPERCFRVFSQN